MPAVNVKDAVYVLVPVVLQSRLVLSNNLVVGTPFESEYTSILAFDKAVKDVTLICKFETVNVYAGTNGDK